jgi:hypothetical protein
MLRSGAMADCDAEVRIGAVARAVGTAVHTRPRRGRTRRTQATAIVWPDGAGMRADGIVRVDGGGASRYCVVVADHVDWRRSVPVVSLPPGPADSSLATASAPTTACGDDPHQVTVHTGLNNVLADRAFDLLIP